MLSLSNNRCLHYLLLRKIKFRVSNSFSEDFEKNISFIIYIYIYNYFVLYKCYLLCFRVYIYKGNLTSVFDIVFTTQGYRVFNRRSTAFSDNIIYIVNNSEDIYKVILPLLLMWKSPNISVWGFEKFSGVQYQSFELIFEDCRRTEDLILANSIIHL